MNFLADVNVSSHVVEGPCGDGFNVVRVSDVMDGRTKDTEIIAEARRCGAVVIGYDQDFTAILTTTGAMLPSLVNPRVSYVDVDILVRNIGEVIRATEAELAAGAIVTLDDAGARVHLLPIR